MAKIELPPGSENIFNPNKAYLKEIDALASKYSKGIDVPSDYSRVANKYGFKTDALMKKISEYASKYSEDFPKATKQTSGIGKEIPQVKNILSGITGKAATAELSALENMVRPVGSALAGAIEAIPPINKYAEENPTASLKEAALSPEGSKGIARGIGAIAGLEAGAELGAMSPVLKGPVSLAGAVGGSMVGAKLGELLTGVPSVDKLIRAAYEKQLREREAKMAKDTEVSSKSNATDETMDKAKNYFKELKLEKTRSSGKPESFFAE